MKNTRFLFAVLVVVLSMIISGCNPDEPSDKPDVKPDDKPGKVAVTGISLDKPSLTLTVGQTATLAATISPANANNKGVKWSSSKSSVATVDSGGTVTAVQEGQARITVTTDDGGFTAACEITVQAAAPEIISVTGVDISDDSLSLEEGQSAVLTATVLPDNATDKTVSWSSDNTSVVTVDQGGNLNAVGAGQATVTVTTTDGGFSASCNVTVAKPVIHVTEVTLNKESVEMRSGGIDRIAETVLPENAEDKSVTWFSTDESIVTIKPNGVLEAYNPGQAEIIVVTKDGNKTARCQVTVTPIHVNYVGVSTSNKIVYVGSTLQVDLVIQPVEAFDQSVVWSSSNEAIATVDQNGLISGHSEGTVIISATSNDGGITGKYEFWVRNPTYPVTAIALDRTALIMNVGTEETLLAEISPSNATNKAIRWLSSDLNVAWVYPNGLVIAKGLGTATITARSEDGGKEAYCTVTVGGTDPHSVAGVCLNVTAMTLIPGQFGALTAYVYPTTAANQLVTWSSSNTSVATVDDAGHVTGVKAGKAVITVTTKDGGKTATCEVTVQNDPVNVSGLTLNRTSITLDAGQNVQLVGSVTPSNATNPNLEWSSDNPSVAIVNPGGFVIAVNPGTARISAVSHNGHAAVCLVTVTRKVKSISINGAKTMTAKTSTLLTAEISPSNAEYKDINWSSSNTSIATVGNDGVVKAISTGSVTITAAAKDGSGVKATHTITVTPARSSYIMLGDDHVEAGDPLNLTVGEYLSFNCRLYPLGTTAAVEWECSDDPIVEILPFTGANPEYQRTLHALKKGVCIITLTASDTGIQRSFTVVVRE